MELGKIQELLSIEIQSFFNMFKIFLSIFSVLTTFVEGIGRKGDIVSVKPGVAYNKLLLPGFATYKTPENVEKYSRTQEDELEKHSSPFAQRVV